MNRKKNGQPRPLTDQDREIMRRIGQRITNLRHQTGSTPAKSEVYGFRRFGIEELEAGTGNPRLTTLLDISKELKTTVADLLKDIA